MILVDTGPLVGLFDAKDDAHRRCVRALQGIDEPLVTTVPVLTEACHLLTPGTTGCLRLLDFVAEGGLDVRDLDDGMLLRAFELMGRYANVPMDLADASLVVLAERLKTRKVFTIDRRDFEVYRIRRGHRHVAFEVFA